MGNPPKLDSVQVVRLLLIYVNIRMYDVQYIVCSQKDFGSVCYYVERVFCIGVFSLIRYLPYLLSLSISL